MDRLQTILVGIDFSPCSATALRQAIRISSWHRARLVALNVVPIPMYPVPAGSFGAIDLPSVESLRGDAIERWSTWAPARSAPPELTFDVAVGVPRLDLVDRARGIAADLLVIGAHSETDSARSIGSTASYCVQRAGTRVLVVREAHAAPFRSLVACVDFSDTSRLVIEQAIRLAAQDDAELHILHVFEDPWRSMNRSKIDPGVLANAVDHFGTAMTQRLNEFCSPHAHELTALKARLHAVRSNGPAKGVLDFIQHHQCDLAVLGTRRDWNLRDFLWGSTAERVVREAPCSILTLKPNHAPATN